MKKLFLVVVFLLVGTLLIAEGLTGLSESFLNKKVTVRFTLGASTTGQFLTGTLIKIIDAGVVIVVNKDEVYFISLPAIVSIKIEK